LGTDIGEITVAFRDGENMFELCGKVKTIMNKFGFSWFIAGGWAIDLFLGQETRIHEDIEIGIYRKHQIKIYHYFEKKKKFYINNKSLIGKHVETEWNGEYLRLPIHEIYIDFDDFKLEILLNERDEENWIYRRNDKIRLNAKSIIQYTNDRIPYLCPEVVLLYKTKELREKDIEDISKASKKMNESQISWLIDSIKDMEIREKVKKLTTAST
jgi:hypothetical protein